MNRNEIINNYIAVRVLLKHKLYDSIDELMREAIETTKGKPAEATPTVETGIKGSKPFESAVAKPLDAKDKP